MHSVISNPPSLPKPPKQAPRGMVYPPPTPSLPPIPGELFVFCFSPRHLRQAKSFAKCVFPVYGPVWDEQWRHQTRNYTHHTCHSTSICPKCPQSDPKINPKSPSYAKRNPRGGPNRFQIHPYFYNIIKICGENECFENVPSYTQSDSTMIQQ